MAKYDNLNDFLTGVANAIRTRKGISSQIQAQDFESEILSIPGGGSSSEYGEDVLPTPINATSGTSAAPVGGGQPSPASATVTISLNVDLTNYNNLYFCWNGILSCVHYGTCWAKLTINGSQYFIYDEGTGWIYDNNNVEIIKKIDVSAMTGVPTITLTMYAESVSTQAHYWAVANVNVKHIYVN